MRLGTKENPRHIAGISLGKDSTALVIYLKNTNPEIFEKLELYFTDTGTELPETYAQIDIVEKYLGKSILRIKATTNEDRYNVVEGEDGQIPFDDVLDQYKGYLPAPNARWCTRALKIEPMERWIGSDYCISYVGIRADEPAREGYIAKGKNKNITVMYPFRENGLMLQDIYDILDASVGIPSYYKWRTRSGCFFCFYQRRVEWAIMYHLYPEWFEKSKQYETEHEDGRTFTWVKDKPLEYVAENSISIIERYIKKQYKKAVKKDSNIQFTYSLDEMLELIHSDNLLKLVDSWDIKKLHDVDGENKDGCDVCTI